MKKNYQMPNIKQKCLKKLIFSRNFEWYAFIFYAQPRGQKYSIVEVLFMKMAKSWQKKPSITSALSNLESPFFHIKFSDSSRSVT